MVGKPLENLPQVATHFARRDHVRDHGRKEARVPRQSRFERFTPDDRFVQLEEGRAPDRAVAPLAEDFQGFAELQAGAQELGQLLDLSRQVAARTPETLQQAGDPKSRAATFGDRRRRGVDLDGKQPS